MFRHNPIVGMTWVMVAWLVVIILIVLLVSHPGWTGMGR